MGADLDRPLEQVVDGPHDRGAARKILQRVDRFLDGERGVRGVLDPARRRGVGPGGLGQALQQALDLVERRDGQRQPDPERELHRGERLGPRRVGDRQEAALRPPARRGT